MIVRTVNHITIHDQGEDVAPQLRFLCKAPNGRHLEEFRNCEDAVKWACHVRDFLTGDESMKAIVEAAGGAYIPNIQRSRYAAIKELEEAIARLDTAAACVEEMAVKARLATGNEDACAGVLSRQRCADNIRRLARQASEHCEQLAERKI